MRARRHRLALPLSYGALALCLVSASHAAPAADNDTSAVLRGTITDAETGALIACTVTITDSAGKIVTESDALKGGFRCEGTFEKHLSPGLTKIRVTRGFETRALNNEVLLLPGAATNVAFKLERTVNLRQRGWFAGDSHAHMIHGERTLPVDFGFVALTARAEDLHYLSLTHAWQMSDPTPEKLDTALARHSTPTSVLTWNIESPKNYYKGDAGRCLGHCWSVGVRGRTAEGADVIPLLLRASAADYESSKPTFANFETHQLIHAQGGAVFYTHPLRWWTGPWGGQGGYPKQERMRVSNMAVELPLDTLLGPTYDGLDVFTSGGEAAANDKAFQLWALLLNHGYRIAATGSSDACFDRPGGAVPGSARTYTHLDEPFSLAALAKATAAGRTFATTGPLLLTDMAGLPPGSSVPADGKDRLLRIEAWPSGKDTSGLQQVEIFRNGKSLRTETFMPPLAAWQTNLVLRETESSWYCVRVSGGPQGGRAVSGAFFFDPAPHRPPPPAACRVRVKVIDAVTGHPLEATLTEVTGAASAVPHDSAHHTVTGGQGVLEIPGTVRLRAEARGYTPLTLSPIYDCPALVEAITRLEDNDLLNWETFERFRALLACPELTFKLETSTR